MYANFVHGDAPWKTFGFHSVNFFKRFSMYGKVSSFVMFPRLCFLYGGRCPARKRCLLPLSRVESRQCKLWLGRSCQCDRNHDRSVPSLPPVMKWKWSIYGLTNALSFLKNSYTYIILVVVWINKNFIVFSAQRLKVFVARPRRLLWFGPRWRVDASTLSHKVDQREER